ncbi:MAG TPA: rod shape-determining protein MreC [Solirubrobacterales bacterium]
MYRKEVRRRRAVLVGLIVCALVLLSLHFSEPESGPLHTIQRGVSTVLSPLESVASGALKPARDLVNWFDETFEARGENEQLREEVAELRAQLADAEQALAENEQFRDLLGLNKQDELADFTPVTGRVIARSPSVWYSTVTINVGSADGVERDDVVVAPGGRSGALVGRVSDVTSTTAQVRLITDHRNAASAKVLPDGPDGIVAPEAGDPDDLVLEVFEGGDEISKGDILVTAGWSDGELASAYPYGIEIGEVVEEGDPNAEVQQLAVRPYVDMRRLQYVQVLTGGPERPEVQQ